MVRRFWFLISLLTMGSCAAQPTGPAATLEGLPDGLSIEFRLDPDEVHPHDSFSAVLEITNVRSDTVRVVTGNGCLVISRVIRDGASVPFQGSAWGCTAAVRTHVFPPHETRSMIWDMRAELFAIGRDDVDGAPAPAGEYVVQAEFDVPRLARTGRKPILEDTLLVTTDAAGPS